MIYLTAPTTQHAWEVINEYLMFSGEKLKESGIRVSSQLIAYNVVIDINKAWIDPEFDFARLFGYHLQKWVRLLANYLSLNQLDLVKSQIQAKERANAGSYNIAYKFTNQHDSGKGCLLSVVFQRRHKDDTRRMIVNIRSSEVTKRLIFDFLLIQRMGEYIYGEGVDLAVTLFCGNMWSSIELLTGYHIHKDLHKLLKGKENDVTKKMLELLEKFSDPDYAESLKYKVHIRICRQLIAKDGFIGFKAKLKTLARDCKLPGQ